MSTHYDDHNYQRDGRALLKHLHEVKAMTWRFSARQSRYDVGTPSSNPATASHRGARQSHPARRATSGCVRARFRVGAAMLVTLSLAVSSPTLRRGVSNRAVAAASASVRPGAARRVVLTPAQKAREARARQVASTLERLLRARVSSPGKRLQLVIRPGARADEGYFSEIFLSGRPIQVKKLSITELSLRARQVHLDVPALLNEGKIRTLASQSALRAIVTESDLTALLARGRGTRAMALRVKYLGDRIRISGTLNWGWISGPVTSEGRLRLVPGSRVNFDILSLKLNGAELPGFVKSRFSDRINPVLSYEDIPFQPRFRSLQLKGNKAILTA